MLERMYQHREQKCALPLNTYVQFYNGQIHPSMYHTMYDEEKMIIKQSIGPVSCIL